MRSRPLWRRSAATFVTAGVTAACTLVGLPSHAAQSEGLRELTYVKNGNLYTAQLDGSHPHVLVSGGVSGTAAWFPDGSQVAYLQNGNLFLARADGTQVRQVTTDGQASEPQATTLAGFPRVLYQDAGNYTMISEDPARSPWSYRLTGTDATLSAGFPWTIFVDPSGDLNIQFLTLSPANVQAKQPAVSPDGTEVAYIDPATNQIAVRSLTQSTSNFSQYDLGTPTVVTADSAADAHPQWSLDGASLVYESGGNVLTVRATASGAAGRLLVRNASGPAEVAMKPKFVVRESGGDVIDTAIAVSQRTFGTVGATSTDGRLLANGVVLADSDSDSAALVGGQFAGSHAYSLLLTGSASLKARVFAEIKRVLAPGGQVYLLGSTDELSAGIQTELATAGYQITRLAGQDMYDTAVKIDQQEFIGFGGGTTLFVASSSSPGDVFAAGPVASQRDGVVVLAQGGAEAATLPAESLAYINSFTPVDPQTGQGSSLVAVGDAGYQAIEQALHNGLLSNWPADTPVTEIAGADAPQTAVAVGHYLEPGKFTTVIAPVSDWHEQLLGASAATLNGGVLLYSGPSQLDSDSAAFLAQNSPVVNEVDLIGGATLLSPQVARDTKPQIALSKVVTYLQVTPGSVPPVLLGGATASRAVPPADSRVRAADHIK
ncbi:MAG TPA: cell wall-binding repeat-containing protein [Actinocrinis sp.]|nr:cell wall-binding repeat-containing protein [Actinocrinis sp.]